LARSFHVTKLLINIAFFDGVGGSSIMGLELEYEVVGAMIKATEVSD
jgi:hypothetical protein